MIRRGKTFSNEFYFRGRIHKMAQAQCSVLWEAAQRIFAKVQRFVQIVGECSFLDWMRNSQEGASHASVVVGIQLNAVSERKYVCIFKERNEVRGTVGSLENILNDKKQSR